MITNNDVYQTLKKMTLEEFAQILSSYSEMKNENEKIIEKYPLAEVYAVYEKDGTKQIVTNKTIESDFILHDNSYSIIKI